MDIFYAVAEPRRREIVQVLAVNGELSASAISKKFNISAPAISQHLKVLREANLVTMKKSAQQRLYTINLEGLNEIEDWLKKLNDVWEARYDRLEELLEKENKKRN